MFSHKDYLLLWEFTQLEKLVENSTINEMCQKINSESQHAPNSAIIDEIGANTRLNGLKVSMVQNHSHLKLFAYEDSSHHTLVVCLCKNPDDNPNNMTFETMEGQNIVKLVQALEQIKKLNRCIMIGAGLSGLYAGYIASKLDVEGVLFGTYHKFPFSGTVRNYVGENEPVGESIENIVFIRQNEVDENTGPTYLNRYVFHDDGNVVLGSQSDYSRFSSWLFNIQGDIRGEVWNLFFAINPEEEFYMEKNLFSMSLKVHELSAGQLQWSLERVVHHMDRLVMNHAGMMKKEFETELLQIDPDDFDTAIQAFARNLTTQSMDLLQGVYLDVEKIITGIGLFKSDERDFNMERLRENLHVAVEGILERHTALLHRVIEEQQTRFLDQLTGFPDGESMDKEWFEV